MKNLWRTVRFFWTLWLFCLTDFAGFRTFARRTIPRRFSKERIRLLAFRLWLTTTENYENRLWNWVNLLVFGLKSHLDRTEKQEKNKINSLWQLEKRENPFRVVERMLTRKKFRLWFCSFPTTFCILTATKRKQKWHLNAETRLEIQAFSCLITLRQEKRQIHFFDFKNCWET